MDFVKVHCPAEFAVQIPCCPGSPMVTFAPADAPKATMLKGAFNLTTGGETLIVKDFAKY